MSHGAEPLTASEQSLMPPAHGRILLIMGVLGAAGCIAGAVFHSFGFGAGILLGSTLAFVNYYWLKVSLKRIFDEAGEGERPKISALRYISRYLTLGAVIAVIYVSGVLPIVAVILGLAAFGFATVVEGFIRIFSSFRNGKEI
jgi:hypothetical protein